MSWVLRFAARADRDLARLPPNVQDEIIDAAERAAFDPASADFKKLRGSDDQWRIRVRRWRAIVRLDNRTGEMIVLRVLPRDQAYR